ncbi:MAG: sensor histidine kinase, partial [Verrucomicrobiota bacterium]
TYTIRDGLPSDSITALSEDNDGRLWIGTENGLSIFENGRFATLAAAGEFQGKAITTLFKDRRGTMWIGAEGLGVFHFLGGKFMAITDPSVEALLKDPHCVLVDQSVRVWVAAGDDFVLCRERDVWHRYRIPHHLARPYVSVLAESPDGAVWAGSVSEGLFQFQGGKLAAFNANNGLADNFVESLLVDREGSLWVGTAGGLNRLRRGNLSVLGQTEGLGYGAVHGLAETAPGIVWAGKPSDGLYQWAGKNFNRLNADFSRRYPEVNALLAARDGSCWVACAHGLLRFDSSESDAPYAEQPALADVNVIALAQNQEGNIWAGTREGQLWLQHNGGWRLQTNFAQPHAITALAPEPDGSLWIGTEGGGVYRFKGTVMAHLERNDRLLSSLIRTLYRDPSGTLWVGTAGGGLTRWQNGRMDTFTSREGLPDNTISQILEDDTGRLWLGSNRGIACVLKSDLEKLAAGRAAAVYPRVFGRAEGMLAEECTGGFSPAGLKLKSGLLWFATLKGIVVVNPKLNANELPAPRVVLEEILVDGLPSRDFLAQSFTAGVSHPTKSGRAKAEMVEISPGRHRIDFRYSGPSFNAPEQVRFRYQLVGFDPAWVEAGTGRSAIYSYVPPGDYRFQVMACDSQGRWKNAGAEVSFRVLPHFWQTWWFFGLAIVGGIALVGSVFRYAAKRNLQRRLAQLEQEHALERERSRIAQDLHDDLGSSLARISLLSGLVRADKEQPAQVETHANKISLSANQTVRALEEIVWAVRPGSDTLQSLVEYIAHFANELFEDHATRCRLDLPHDLPALALPPDVRHNMFLIVKELLTNALKHAAAREVRVQAKVEGDVIEFLIEDDGKGFLPVAQTTGKRNGLANIRHRVETIGGKLELQSTVGSGTSIRQVVPVNQNRGRA